MLHKKILQLQVDIIVVDFRYYVVGPGNSEFSQEALSSQHLALSDGLNMKGYKFVNMYFRCLCSRFKTKLT